MEAENSGGFYIKQEQPYYPFPFHQVTDSSLCMENMNEQYAGRVLTDPENNQQSIPEPANRNRKRAKCTEPKKPAAKAPKVPKAAKSKGKQEKITDTFKVKRKVDRFNGVSEAEILTKTLPDILTFNLDIVIIGINPGLMAAYKGHHYPGPGNHFCIYEIFSKEIFGVKIKKFEFGLQPHKVPDTETLCYVMPSSSARCAQFPRAQDKVHHYIKLKDLRDQMKGIRPSREVQEVNYSFDLQLAQEDAKKMAVKEEQHDPGYDAAYGENPTVGESGLCNFPSDSSAFSQESNAPTSGQVPNGQWMSQSFMEHNP